MMNKTKLQKKFLIHLKTDIKIIWNQSKIGGLSLIMFSYCIVNAIKQILIVVDHK